MDPWIKAKPDDIYVRRAYTKLVGRYGTTAARSELAIETMAWLERHPEDAYVRTAFLHLFHQRPLLSPGLFRQAITITLTWLELNGDNTHVLDTLLKIIKRVNSPALRTRLINVCYRLLTANPDNTRIWKRYLELLSHTNFLTADQVQEAMRFYAASFPSHRALPGALHAYQAYLRLMRAQGSREQQRATIDSTFSWLPSDASSAIVWPALLDLVTIAGSEPQQHNAISLVANWLARHRHSSYVWAAYLKAIRKCGSRAQLWEALASAQGWFENRREECYVLTPYLILLEVVTIQSDEAEQYEQLLRAALEQAAAWLEAHWHDKQDGTLQLMRALIRLVEARGSSAQRVEALAVLLLTFIESPDVTLKLNVYLLKDFLTLAIQHGTQEQRRRAYELAVESYTLQRNDLIGELLDRLERMQQADRAGVEGGSAEQQ
jgi:hypothetical protein